MALPDSFPGPRVSNRYEADFPVSGFTGKNDAPVIRKESRTFGSGRQAFGIQQDVCSLDVQHQGQDASMGKHHYLIAVSDPL